MTFLKERPERIAERYISGDDIDALVKSLDDLFEKDAGRTIFIDTNVFYFPVDEMQRPGDYNTEETTVADFVRRGTRFNQLLARTITSHPQVTLHPNVLYELEGLLTFSGGRIVPIKDAFLEKLAEEGDERARESREALIEYEMGSRQIFPLLAERRYQTDDLGNDLAREFLSLLQYLDRQFSLKKQSSMETDELIVAHAFAEAARGGSSGVLSRDNDVHRLFTQAVRIFGDSDMKSFSPLLGEMDIGNMSYVVDPHPKGYYEAINMKRVLPYMGESGLNAARFINDRHRREVLKVAAKTLSHVCDYLGIGTASMVSDFRERMHRDRKESLDLASTARKRSRERPKERGDVVPHQKKFTRRGHRGLLKRVERKRAEIYRPFSGRFLKEFREIPIVQCEEDGAREARNHREKPYAPLPADLNPFIASVWRKYSDDSNGGSHLVPFSRWRAYRFMDYLRQRGERGRSAVELAKAYVEYGLFMWSIQGDSYKGSLIPGRDFDLGLQGKRHPADQLMREGTGDIPIDDIHEFYKFVNAQGKLDPERLQSVMREWKAIFQPLSPEEDLLGGPDHDRAFAVRFDPFIVYKTVDYLNRENRPVVDARVKQARVALEEAITKYGMDVSNLENYLDLALCHITWGVATDPDISFPNGRMPSSLATSRGIVNPAAPSQERLYLAEDIFRRAGVSRDNHIYHALVESGAEPVVSERKGRWGYFVAQGDAAKLVAYLDSGKMINYRALRRSI